MAERLTEQELAAFASIDADFAAANPKHVERWVKMVGEHIAALTRELEEARTQLEARWLDTKSPLMRDIIENGRWAAGIEEAAEMAEQYGREYISKPCAMLAEALREKLLSRTMLDGEQN